MVHALHEAWRVLRPDGILIDLRPAAVHRRVGVRRGGEYLWLGAMRERFNDDNAANRAVAEALRRGWFKAGGRVRFECKRTMDSLAEFRAWLDEFVALGKLPAHDWLWEKVEQARGRTKIVVAGPLDLRVLMKQAAGRRA